jgi:uncharacterized Zn finger protein (UPF0148 family)
MSDERKSDDSPPPSIADTFRQRLAQAAQPAADPLPEPPPLVPLIPAEDPVPTPPAFPDPSRYPITYGLTHVGTVEPWALTIYHTALAQLERRQWDEARASLRRAVDAQGDFVDPHLWLGRLARTPEERREHYGTVIALLGNHLEAARELMVLNGQLSREEADRSERGEVAWARPDAPILAQGQALRCPQCGGDLSQHVAQAGKIACRFCGHVLLLDELGQGSGARSLQMAMLKRRGQERVWAISERLLHCNACGAERVLPPDQLSSRCPFCGSNQVIQADSQRTFEQPDGLIPFRIDEAEARAALHEALNSPLERVKGWFINNKVKDMRLRAVFLPFWVFDAHLIIHKTIRDERSVARADQRALQAAYQRQEFHEMAHDVAIFGGETPPQQQVARLSVFDWQAALPYQAERLAGVDAQLYTVDYEAASLLARERMTQTMREKHGYDPDHSDKYSVSVVALVQQMEFRLLLCPFWMAHLLEEDGDRRLALIQGQQGRVALGQASKPR